VCGISAVVGRGWDEEQLEAMVKAQAHRGPDDAGTYVADDGVLGLGNNRLSILDLSPAGRMPMSSPDGSRVITFNGEIYNYLELRRELADYPYRSGGNDTEVFLAAYERWGEACLERLVGMFAFALWDARERKLFAARDRFGVKPMVYHRRSDGTIFLASEIKALHEAGVPARADPVAWATYLTYGLSDHGERTFWDGIRSLPPGHSLVWRDDILSVRRWYDLAEGVGEAEDVRTDDAVADEYLALATETVRLRFRSDVPVGINLSGGLDSSTLLALVDRLGGREAEVTAFTFTTGDPGYDELPWVQEMLAGTRHSLVVSELSPKDVPELAVSVQHAEDEPFGGIPTLAYARLFETAREHGTTVLLDGQGMDEQWAGYDYYRDHLMAFPGGPETGPVQGSHDASVRPDCLTPEFRALAEPLVVTRAFPDALRSRQHVDASFAKIPRALRYNDRVSMRASTELREPFLDHRLVELAFRQPAARKISDGTHKALLRRIVSTLLPRGVVDAPKRPVQTPQREWLRGPLAPWAEGLIDEALAVYGGTWLEPQAVRAAWRAYSSSPGDNSHPVWQWLNLGLWHQSCLASRTLTPADTPPPAFRAGRL
jgi:asparagine synthase (glutamine-hydrolysing)